MLSCSTDTNNDLIIHFASNQVPYQEYVVISTWQRNCEAKCSAISDGKQAPINPSMSYVLTKVTELFHWLARSHKASDWRDTFPEGVIDALLIQEAMFTAPMYPQIHFVAKHEAIAQMLLANHMVFRLVMRFAQQNQLSAREIDEFCKLKRVDLLKRLGLPGNKATFKNLGKLGQASFGDIVSYRNISPGSLFLEKVPLNYSPDEVKIYSDDIIYFDWAKFNDSLNHLYSYPSEILSFLTRHPEYTSFNLLISIFNKTSNNKAKEHVKLFEDTAAVYFDFQELNRNAHESRNRFLQYIQRARTIKDIQEFHDDLTMKYNEKLRIKRAPCELYPPMPFQETEHIKAISNSNNLSEEGYEMKHCVAAYDIDIREGNYFVYKILEPERATLGLRKTGNSWEIDQLYKKFNQEVSLKTKLFVDRWMRAKQST